MKRTASISEILRPLKDAPFQAYLSSALQVADILEWVLEQTGTAEVWQTSFSISEEFLRRLFFLKRKRPISRFNLVLDHKATNKTIKLWSFIVQVVDRTFLADNHSKILLVRSDRGDTVAVVTSQNLTRGNRAESAYMLAYFSMSESCCSVNMMLSEFICCGEALVEQIIQWYGMVLDDVED